MTCGGSSVTATAPRFPMMTRVERISTCCCGFTPFSPNAAEKKMQFEVEVLAPWMPKSEADDLLDSYLRCDPRRVRPSREELRDRINLTNAERERLKVWRIHPVDMTAEDLAEQRKEKKRDRDQARRRDAGAVSRQAYEANAKQRLKPWEAEKVSRATWYRRHDKSALDDSY